MKVIDRKFFLDNLKAYDTNVVQKALSNIETATVDSTLSELSTNAIQNKAVATAINNEIGERESADEVLQGQITANTNAINTLNGTGVGSVTKTVADKISEVIANAPADFDTLKEISDWISTHENSASSMNTAINKNAINLSNHIANKSNPHGVTKAQIGLENVANYNQSKAIVSISRNGTTFTATHLDGTTSTFTQQDNNTTYSNATTSTAGLMSAADKTKLDGVATGANNYTHPTTSGNKHIPSGGSSGQILRWSADGTAVWGNDNNTTYSNFKAATASAAGSSGLVPAPAAGANTKYLRGDGTWATPISISVSGNTATITY